MRTKNKDKELNHRHFIGLRLTDVELDLLDQGAACLSISRSEYLRKLLLEKQIKGYCFMSCKTIYVMISSFLSEEEKMIVAAHELGHIILHRSQLKMAPMQDDTLYNMTDNTEYQANLFAADLLIEDEDIEEMVQNEDLDYFGLCSSLNATPELMSFKLYSLTKRGQAYHMPMEIQSNFLAK